MSIAGEALRRQNSRDKLLAAGVRPPPPPQGVDTFLYVYGTLRPGGKVLHRVPGRMYDLGSYPGVTLDDPGDNFFLAEKVLVSPDELKTLDGYEGYRPSSPETSLYLRIPYRDGEIYVYNQPVDKRKLIIGGDWVKYTGRQEGSAAVFMGVSAWDYDEIGDPGNLPSHFPVGHNQCTTDVESEESSAGYSNLAMEG